MKPNGIRWTGRALIATILAVGVSVSLMAAFLANAIHADALTGEAATLLSTAFGAVVGALAAYLGQSGDRDASRRSTDTPATLEPPHTDSEDEPL